MGQRATATIVVAASPETVYAVAADFANYPSWVADLKSVAILETDGEGRPAVVEFRAAAFGRTSTYSLRYNYDLAPGVLSWSQHHGDLTTTLNGLYRFDAVAGGTEVTYELDVELLVPLPSFVKNRAAQRIQAQALRELKTRAERG